MLALYFSYTERSSKPRAIPKPVSGKVNIKQSAAMMLTLMRILPMLIGHLIEPDCPYWHLYKLLRQIMDLTMSPIFSVDATYYLESVVSDHHRHFKQLFPNRNITPKHHFMLHYGEAIRRCGPLRHLWCMRFESKHQLAKKVGDLTNNFRNIALTVATQYSLSTFSSWKLNKIFPKTSIEHSTDGMRVTSFSHCGQLFKPGSVIRYDKNENMRLCKIDSIVIDDSKVIFKCKKLSVDDYSEHFCAFPVMSTDIDVDVEFYNLTCTTPLSVHFNQKGDEYVYLSSIFNQSFHALGSY